MNRMRIVIAAGLTLGVATQAVAQELSDVCPGAEPRTAALWGLLADADAGMGLPGATVVATWTIDGAPGRAAVQTSIDGGFTLCHVPLDIELSVVGMIGAISSEPIAITMTEPIVRQDIALSLTGASGAGAGGEGMLACLGDPDSEFRRQMAEFVRCDPRWRGLEHCPREDLGRVSAISPLVASRGGGRSSGMPRWLDELIEEARELGANALVNYRRNGEVVAAQAALIEVDPASC